VKIPTHRFSPLLIEQSTWLCNKKLFCRHEFFKLQ